MYFPLLHILQILDLLVIVHQLIPEAEGTSYRVHRTDASCVLPVDEGLCKEQVTRYGYSCETNTCSEFTYGGCGGNGNRYASLEQCEASCKKGKVHCKTSTAPIPKEQGARRWKKKKQSGRGQAGLRMYYHQRKRHMYKKKVEEVTEAPSEDEVQKKKAENPSCSYPADPGKCKGSISRFAYDCESNSCKEFKYGGCGGNSNRFPKIDSCEKACKWKQPYCNSTKVPHVNKDDLRWKRKRQRGRGVQANSSTEVSESNEEKSASTSVAASDEETESEESSSSSEEEESEEVTTTTTTTKKPKGKKKKGDENKKKEEEQQQTTKEPDKKKKKKKVKKVEVEATGSSAPDPAPPMTTTTVKPGTTKKQCKSSLLGLVCF